jgi:hypothetical protein
MHGNTVRYSTEATAALTAIASRGRLQSDFEAEQQAVRFEEKTGSS